MYLISKFVRDLMEHSLQNMRNDRAKTTQKITTATNTSLENDKEELQTSNRKKTQSEKENKAQVYNENDIVISILEVSYSSIEPEKLSNDKAISVNRNPSTSEKDLIDTYR